MSTNNTKMRQSVKWTAGANITNGSANAIITVILAALLGPSEYGLVAIAVLLVTILEIIPGFGLETALIQRAKLEPKNLNAVFWFNLIFGIVFASMAILLSGWWATVNGSTLLCPVIMALSALIPINCLALVQTALLKRTMEFKHIAVRDISATFASGMIGIGFALAGMGVWSLVFQKLTRSVVSCVLVWRASSWRPNGGFKWDGLKSLMEFSSKTFIGQLGVFFQNNTDSIVMGALFGPTAVGYYRFSSRLIEMVMTFFPRAIQVVALPHFSGIQNDQKSLFRAFFKGSHVSCLVTLPFLALMAGAPEHLLGTIGDKWLPAALTLSFLTFIGLGKAILLLTGPLLQSLSKPGIHSINTWVFAIVNGIGVIIVAKFSDMATACDQSARIALMRAIIFWIGFAPLLLWQIKRVAGIATKRLFLTLRGVLLSAILTAIIISFLNKSYLFEMIQNPIIDFAFVSSIAGIIWFVLLRIFDRSGFDILWVESCRIFKELIIVIKP